MKTSVQSSRPPAEELIPTRSTLLARLKDLGDERSWADFYETYRRLIWRCAREAGLAEAEAEDVVQETVIAVARRMPSFHYDPADCSFKTWLYLVVRGRIADHYRRRGRRVVIAEPSPDEGTGTGLLEQIPDPASLQPDAAWEEEWEQVILAEALKRVRTQVKPEHFQLYNYHVIQGHSVEETTAHLQTNRAKVYMAKLRVGRLLKKELERRTGKAQ